jgi:hypothetical protein
MEGGYTHKADDIAFLYFAEYRATLTAVLPEELLSDTFVSLSRSGSVRFLPLALLPYLEKRCLAMVAG